MSGTITRGRAVRSSGGSGPRNSAVIPPALAHSAHRRCQGRPARCGQPSRRPTSTPRPLPP